LIENAFSVFRGLEAIGPRQINDWFWATKNPIDMIFGFIFIQRYFPQI